MTDDWAVKGVSRGDKGISAAISEHAGAQQPAPQPGASKQSRANYVSLAVGVIGLAALGASAWVYAETQRDIKRVSTDIAQIRLSLELFGRQTAADSGAVATNDGLLDLANRLAVLEANQRDGSAAIPASALPTLPSDAIGDGVIATGGDCLPVGTRFMVAPGDSYAVCGTAGTVSVAAVDEGYITLSDGTIIAQGGTVGLPNTQCMLGVVPSDGGDLSGFAEIRVVC